MSEELDLLLLVARRLDAAGIPYMLSGSTAMNAYAEPRMTRDIDIVVEIGVAEIDTMAEAFHDDFYCDRDMIRQAVEAQASFNVIHTPTVIKVDFIVRTDAPYRKTEFMRRRALTIQGQVIHLVSPEDLVLSKLVWAKPSHSEVQLRDVRNLLACADARLGIPGTLGRRFDRDGPACRGADVTDTSPEIARLQRRLLLERSGADRLAMGCAMFDTARALMRAGLGDPTGADRSPAMQVRVFQRTYARDFDAATAARIIAHVSRAADPGR